MRAPRTILAVAAAGLIATAVPALAQQQADVEVVDSAYAPREVTVEVGGTVTWTQTGNLPHSVTADDGSFDSHPDCGNGGACMGAGDTFSQAFDEPGEHAYYCRIHGGPGGVGMSGVVVVTAAGEAEYPTEEPADGPTEEPSDDAGTLPETGAPVALLVAVLLTVLLMGAVTIANDGGSRRPSDGRH